MSTEEIFQKKRAELSEAKRALLEKRLQQVLQREETNSITSPILHAQHEIAPLSFAQQRIWFLQQLELDSPAYNEPIVLRLSGKLDVDAFLQTAREIMRRHELLRSTFPIVEERLMQKVDPTAHFNLTIEQVDLRGVRAEEREAAVQKRVQEEVLRPFRLTEELPWRVVLLRLDETEHVSITVMHHIITDAWSMAIFSRETALLYGAFASKQPSPLLELTSQYTNYVQWQQRPEFATHVAEQLTYWKRQLAAPLPVIELPGDRARPASETYRGRHLPLEVPAGLASALRTFCRREGVTPFMALLTAFKIVLARYTQQDDIIIGTPIANRTLPEFEGLLGCFVNTLVLRTDLSGNPSLGEALRRVREVALAAYDHQDVPFEKLVEELQPERDLSRSPLFQIMFVLQNVPITDGQDETGLSISHIEVETGTSKFDLELCLSETGQDLNGYLEYNTDIFEQSTIEHLRTHWLHILNLLVTSPQQRMADFSLLTAAEYQQVAEWNTTHAAYPVQKCAHELFEEQAARTPGNLAARCAGEQLTYQELNQRANQLAYALREQGVGPESLVALLEVRGLSFLTALLAIWKAGGAYLPLDPQHPAARIRQVLLSSGSALILTTRQFEPLLQSALLEIPAEQRPQLLLLSDALRADAPVENLPSLTTPHHLAYVIYTSGSTGQPKGAMIEQGGMLNHLYAKIADLGLKAGDIVAQTATQCFDISVWQFLAALLVGGSVRIYPDEVAHDPTRLLESIEQHRVSIWETVPSLLRLLLESIEGQRQMRPALSHLRWLVPTGEALPTELCARWLALYPAVPLLNAYGPTECSDDVTHHPIVGPLTEPEATMPIGKAVANTRLYLLDRHLSLLPPGIKGELYVGGAGVGRGYRGEARRTAERFFPDPFSTEPGARLYRTGDLARYRADGTLEFFGRSDHQVKLRGYRIELGEIEAGLGLHPAIRACAVLPQEEQAGERLVAYVVVQPGEQPQSSEVRSYLSEFLPDYMLPTAFVMLDELPLNASGKVDRNALALMQGNVIPTEIEYVAPRTPLEESLVQIWQELLSVKRVGIHDNFFNLGGHSLLITKVVARIRETCQVDLPLRVFFRSPTVAGLAEAIQNVQTRTSELRQSSVAPVARDMYKVKRYALRRSNAAPGPNTEG